MHAAFHIVHGVIKLVAHGIKLAKNADKQAKKQAAAKKYKGARNAKGKPRKYC